MPNAYRIELPDPDATTRFAALLAGCLPPRLCIWLSGDLGSGKTHLARGVLRALGWVGAVRSPTYALLETYQLQADETAPAAAPSSTHIGTAAHHPEAFPQNVEAESRLLVYHFDLYRMASPEEWEDAGFDDLPDPAVRLIEWPERGASLTPAADLELVLAVHGQGRTATLTVCSRAGEDTWHMLESALQAQRDASPLRWAPVC